MFINITFDDILAISKMKINKRVDKDYFKIWKNKIEYIEKYCNNKYIINDYDYYYYIGLSRIALNLVKNINYFNISYGVSINRFNNINNIYNLRQYGPTVNTIAEFIKQDFFYNNRVVDITKIDELDLTNDDLLLLISRLLFPTYYFDMLNEIDSNYKIILTRIVEYIEYLKHIIFEIKKRHNNMPFAESIVNLL